jgi:hypothetical protein
MRAKTIQETLNEFGGAGYAVYGGGANYGNPGRGVGFGQSSANKGGPNLMYTYDVKDLNQALQTPPTTQSDEKYVHIGVEAKAKSLETKKWIQGKIISAKEDTDGNIIHYEILNPKTGQTEKVDPTSIELIQNERQPGLTTLDRDIVGESFVPESVGPFLILEGSNEETIIIRYDYIGGSGDWAYARGRQAMEDAVNELDGNAYCEVKSSEESGTIIIITRSGYTKEDFIKAIQEYSEYDNILEGYEFE